jgi:type III secretion system low calcium response chaperone LcrH/SycD
MPAAQASLDLTPEDVQTIMEAMFQGATVAEAAGVTQQQLEALYALGHNLYTTGRQSEAETVFKGLCLYDYSDSRFWTGLGASLQAGAKFREAIDVYSMAAMSSGLKDPAPIYYAALCYLKLDQREEAVAALEGLPVMGEAGNSGHEAVKAQAAGLLEALKGGKGV